MSPKFKGKKNWNKPYPISLPPTLIEWLKEKRRRGLNVSHYVTSILEREYIKELEGVE